jgi:hypothetical protein
MKKIKISFILLKCFFHNAFAIFKCLNIAIFAKQFANTENFFRKYSRDFAFSLTRAKASLLILSQREAPVCICKL